MVNKKLVALVMVARDIESGKTLQHSYFAEKGLGQEGKKLEEIGFIEFSSRKNSYSLTNIGKKFFDEIDEYCEILLEEYS